MTAEEILALVARYHQDSSRRIHLIPSENFTSPAARVPYLTDLMHRYCFPPDTGNAAWPGNDDVARIEAAVVSDLRDLFGTRYANVKPISGLNCMAIAVSALSQPGGVVLSIDEADGGHAATRSVAIRLGQRWVPMPFDRARYRIDCARLADLAGRLTGPVLVYLDQFMCLFPHDLAGVRAAVGASVPIHYDGSHVLGLIAGGQFQDPLREGADSLGGSTHKSLPGAHKGVLLTNDPEIADKFSEHSTYWVSHHHPADIAALAITISEIRKDIRQYATRTVANARRLGHALAQSGFRVSAAEFGFTRSHQLWIDPEPMMSPFAASRALLAAGIVVNAIDIPYLPSGTGLRLGVQEVTRLGFGPEEMDELAELFTRVVIRAKEPTSVRPAVDDLLDRYRDPDADAFIESVLSEKHWS